MKILLKKPSANARDGGNNGKSVVGLDIEASSIAATLLNVNGAVSVAGSGIAPLGTGVVRDGEVQEPAALGEAIKDLFAAHKLPRDVRLGIANQRVAVRALRLPKLEDKSELDAAVRFAAQDHIPMPLDRAVLDWQVIPEVPGTEELGIEVVVVAARREMLTGLTEAVRRAGLRLVGIDHSAFALIRALAGKQSGAAALAATQAIDPATGVAAGPAAGHLYCHLGDITNLAVARGSYCLFSRVLGFGIEGIAQTLSGSSGLTLEHARQWLVHVGLEAPVDQVEGNPETVAMARHALDSGAQTLVDELRRSLEYYAALENAVAIEGIVAAGPGTAIPGLVDRLQHALPVPLAAAVPEPLAAAAGNAAGRLTLSYGLSLEE